VVRVAEHSPARIVFSLRLIFPSLAALGPRSYSYLLVLEAAEAVGISNIDVCRVGTPSSSFRSTSTSQLGEEHDPVHSRKLNLPWRQNQEGSYPMLSRAVPGKKAVKSNKAVTVVTVPIQDSTHLKP
jgi:hypothetical protein